MKHSLEISARAFMARQLKQFHLLELAASTEVPLFDGPADRAGHDDLVWSAAIRGRKTDQAARQFLVKTAASLIQAEMPDISVVLSKKLVIGAARVDCMS